mmetsp:Transcript_21009/g.28257  ORF Transcript_21009/g.28257 Transcript_21009/m.28257 type:complete len:109 (-) Transcript_21009:1241-1567(-)
MNFNLRDQVRLAFFQVKMALFLPSHVYAAKLYIKRVLVLIIFVTIPLVSDSGRVGVLAQNGDVTDSFSRRTMSIIFLNAHMGILLHYGGCHNREGILCGRFLILTGTS